MCVFRYRELNRSFVADITWVGDTQVLVVRVVVQVVLTPEIGFVSQ